MQAAFVERGEASPTSQIEKRVTRSTVSLSHEPRCVPSYNAILIANRVHFGEILNDAGSVGLRLREQSRSQTKAFDRQPWIPDGDPKHLAPFFRILADC